MIADGVEAVMPEAAGLDVNSSGKVDYARLGITAGPEAVDRSASTRERCVS